MPALSTELGRAATCQNLTAIGQLSGDGLPARLEPMADPHQDDTRDALARVERELARLKSGLELLGVKACCCCRNLFRATEPANLFDAGDLVCFACIRHWWPERSPTLSSENRELIERKLVHWLLNYHGAKVIRKPEERPAADQQELRLMASCEECEGKGVWAGTRCHFCDGTGALCLVIPKPEAP